MDAQLAAERLDSKSCYAVLSSKGRLVGYELAGELLVASGGRLLALPALDGHEVGDGAPRRYEAGGVRVDLTPLSDVRRDTIKDVSYSIKERAAVVLVDHGRRRRLSFDVLLNCSP